MGAHMITPLSARKSNVPGRARLSAGERMAHTPSRSIMRRVWLMSSSTSYWEL